MAFQPHSGHILHVVVDGRYDGQQIVNNYYYRYSSADTGLTGGRSDDFLVAFRAEFRLRVLPLVVSSYSVSRYWLRSIKDVALVVAGPPAKFRPVYDPDRLDFLEGVGADVGGILPGVNGITPVHTAVRVLKIPGAKYVGYHSRAYNRYGPIPLTDLDTNAPNHDQMLAARVAVWDAAMATFVDTAIFDQIGGNGWDMCSFSTQYHGRVGKPAGSSITKAAVPFSTAKTSKWLGTQTTRRYKPVGGFRGR